jgi:hypothetical protein
MVDSNTEVYEVIPVIVEHYKDKLDGSDRHVVVGLFRKEGERGYIGDKMFISDSMARGVGLAALNYITHDDADFTKRLCATYSVQSIGMRSKRTLISLTTEVVD